MATMRNPASGKAAKGEMKTVKSVAGGKVDSGKKK
jgi:hypothetical protein